jgi:hypothetical protein
MDKQIVAIGFIGLLLGIGVGYLIGIPQLSNLQTKIDSMQSQINSLDVQIVTKDQTISSLQKQIQDKDVIISNLQSQPKPITYFKINYVSWEISNGIVRVFIENIGSTTTIESVKISKGTTSSGAVWYTNNFPILIIQGNVGTYVWKLSDSNAPSGFLAYGTSYLIQVTCVTGFSDTEVYTSPVS